MSDGFLGWGEGGYGEVAWGGEEEEEDNKSSPFYFVPLPTIRQLEEDEDKEEIVKVSKTLDITVPIERHLQDTKKVSLPVIHKKSKDYSITIPVIRNSNLSKSINSPVIITEDLQKDIIDPVIVTDEISKDIKGRVPEKRVKKFYKRMDAEWDKDKIKKIIKLVA